MCFSPEVSFASAGLLIPTGMYCVWAAGRGAPKLWPLAVVPAVFGVQQACEGLVWLGLRYGDARLCSTAGRLYLFFALAFWPLWFSASAAVMEPHGLRRRMLTAWAALSSAWFWFAYLPALLDPVGVSCCVRHDSVHYDSADCFFQDPVALWGLRALYVATSAAPLMAGSFRRVLLLPVSLGVASAAATVLLYDHAFTSVWCLFSAVLSVSVAHVIVTEGRRLLVPQWARA